MGARHHGEADDRRSEHEQTVGWAARRAISGDAPIACGRARPSRRAPTAARQCGLLARCGTAAHLPAHLRRHDPRLHRRPRHRRSPRLAPRLPPRTRLRVLQLAAVGRCSSARHCASSPNAATASSPSASRSSRLYLAVAAPSSWISTVTPVCSSPLAWPVPARRTPASQISTGAASSRLRHQRLRSGEVHADRDAVPVPVVSDGEGERAPAAASGDGEQRRDDR